MILNTLQEQAQLNWQFSKQNPIKTLNFYKKVKEYIVQHTES